jgi:hypothetical protein
MPKSNAKSVCFIFASSWPEVKPNQLQEVVPEINLLTKISPVAFWYKPDQPAGGQWQALVDLVKQKAAAGFAGIVVVADADLVLYLSNAVSFGWLKPTVPIIFTIGLEDLFCGKKFGRAGGAKANLINAVQLATLAKKQTVILDGFHLIAPSRAIFERSAGTQSISGVQDKFLGKVDFGISFSEESLNITEGWPHHNLFETNFQILDQSQIGRQEVSESVKGLLVINREPQPAQLAKLDKSLPYAIYQPTALLEKTTEPIINYLTWHCLVVKFAWLLAATSNQTLITNGLNTPYMDEIIPT